ncbi:MAG: transposase [Clostridia bacterium]|nr:transposase [Clostridia bacterium]
MKKILQRRVVFIYRQEILKDIRLFTSQPKAKFYVELFINSDLSCIPTHNSKTSCCPCNHKCWDNDKKNRGCTKYVTVPDDYRLSIDRQSIAFKSVYALRTEVERYNSRFKQAGCERVFVRNGNSTKNLNTIAHISLLSIAITAVITKKNVSYRSTKSVKRIA